MPNMTYCRHENTADALADVWSRWDDFDEESATQFELGGRRRLIELVQEMHQRFEEDGVYDALEL